MRAARSQVRHDRQGERGARSPAGEPAGWHSQHLHAGDLRPWRPPIPSSRRERSRQWQRGVGEKRVSTYAPIQKHRSGVTESVTRPLFNLPIVSDPLFLFFLSLHPGMDLLNRLGGGDSFIISGHSNCGGAPIMIIMMLSLLS